MISLVIKPIVNEIIDYSPQDSINFFCLIFEPYAVSAQVTQRSTKLTTFILQHAIDDGIEKRGTCPYS